MVNQPLLDEQVPLDAILVRHRLPFAIADNLCHGFVELRVGRDMLPLPTL